MAKISDLAKEAFAKGDYTIAVDLYKQCIQDKTYNSLDMFMGYGDALACTGRIELSFDAYAHIHQQFGYSVPLDRLHHLSLALLNSVTASVSSQQNRSHQNSASINQQSISVTNGSVVDPLCCALCEDILKCPVTAVCGHTFCGECCYGQTECKICGKVFSTFGDSFKQDVLVLRLVEKWWSPESNERAINYMQRNTLDEALKSCNESLEKCPNNYQGLLLRSEVLYRLSHFKSSLADADNALKSRPTSYKAHLRRAYALSSLGQTEEALLAFCFSTWLNNKVSTVPPSTLTDVAKLFHQLLSSTRKSPQFPLASPYTMRRRRKRRHHDRNIVAESSDCDEENSSEETNFTKTRSRQKTIERRLKCTNTYSDSVIIPRPNTRIRGLVDRIHQEIYRIQKTDSTVNVLKVNPSLVEVTDFDCVLCYRTLWKPVVTPCGHTYCLVCLDRCLYYSSHCPLCKSSFEDDYRMNIVRNALSRKYVTKFIEIAMQRFIPVAYEKRKLQEIEKEEFVPVFICTVSFPYVPCPLFVYESRYRLMIRRAIESGDRQFGIAHAQPHVCQRYSDYGTMLDIRDCVQLSDGRAILSTVGCRRFKVLDRDEKDGYDTAKVEYISDEKISRDRLQAVTKLHSTVFYKAVKWYDSLPEHTKEEILKSFGCMPTLEAHWESVTDGPAWAWYIIAILPLNQRLKVDILATTKLEKRLLAIDKTLEHVAAQKRRSLSVDVMCEGVQTCQAIDCCQRASSSAHLEDDLQQITGPNNYQGLLLRSEVLYRLSHFKSSLADADNALKSRPTSYKAHLRRAYALSSLGQTEEALLAFCFSTWLNNKVSTVPPSTLTDVAKLFHQLLSSTRKSPQFPLASPYTMRRRRKRRHHDRNIVAESSDCDEENSSEETNFTKTRSRQKTIERRLKCTNTYSDSVIIPRPNTRIRGLVDRIHQEIYRIQKTDSTVNVLKVNPSLVEVTDFDCVLCYRTLWKPVVTPCGHTYCLVCLDRCLYYSSHCPLCKSSFEDDYRMNIVRNALSRKYVTKFIEIAMQRFIPVAYEKRKLQEIEKEEFVPVFICTVSFPYVPCPLFVYESRYRLMIRRAIESGDRQFGIAHAQPHVCQRYSDYGTMLDIRDCVQLSDGRAILSTVGCRRFKVLDRDEKDGYDTAKVEYISDEKISRDRLQAVTKLHSTVFYKAVKWYDSLPEHTKEEILKSFGCMPTLEAHWESVTDGPAWAWYIIAILPLNQRLKVDILATTKLEKRLLAIDKTLEHVAAQKRRSLSVDVMCEGVQTCQAIDCCQRASSSAHLEDDLQQIT